MATQRNSTLVQEFAIVAIRMFGLAALVLAIPKVMGQIGAFVSTAKWLNWQIAYIGDNLESAQSMFGFSLGDLLGALAQGSIGLWLLLGCRFVERWVCRGVWGMRQKCVGCGYDLRGASGEACPECGAPRAGEALGAIDSPHERETNETA